ncbi:MAG: hypothetical protein H6620_07420 [Halobacteriovoraceae bacterium]|nr:hypothetical protein [Halobacteriovoraceae bacterium]
MKLLYSISLIALLSSCGQRSIPSGLSEPDIDQLSLFLKSIKDCDQGSLKELLSPDQINTLQAATAKVNEQGYGNEFDAIVLHKEQLALVLLGEVHVKDKEGSALGKAVLNSFPVRSNEGLMSSETKKLPLFLRKNLENRQQAVEEDDDLEGSTISDSHDKASLFYWKDGELNQLVEEGHENLALQELEIDCQGESGVKSTLCDLSSFLPFDFATESFYPINPQDYYPEKYFNDVLVMEPIEQESFAQNYIINARNIRMIDGIQSLFQKYKFPQIISVVGKAHLEGMTGEVLKSSGFSACKI